MAPRAISYIGKIARSPNAPVKMMRASTEAVVRRQVRDMREDGERGSRTLARAMEIICETKIPCGNATQNRVYDDKQPCEVIQKISIHSGTLMPGKHAPKMDERNRRKRETMRVEEEFGRMYGCLRV